MDDLLSYLNGLPPAERARFAKRCGTTENYLRSAISSGKKLGDRLVIAIERETSRKIRCEQLRPDVDWAFIRGTAA